MGKSFSPLMLFATGERMLESRTQNESIVGAEMCPNNLNHSCDKWGSEGQNPKTATME